MLLLKYREVKMKSKIEEAKKRVVVFQGRKYYYKTRFPLTYEDRKGAIKYAEKLAKDTKSWTLVRRVPDIGYCVYITKSMKRGGRL